jgi:DNA-binding MarR family transcriptional regulator
VPVSQAHALMELASGDLSQGELTARLNLERSTVCRLLQQLEARGWIGRERGAEDARVRVVSLTSDGRRVAGEIAEAREAKFAALIESIPPDERDGVSHVLDVLVGALGVEGR